MKLPVIFLEKPLKLLVVHIFLLVEYFIGGLLFTELVLVSLHLNDNILLFSLKLKRIITLSKGQALEKYKENTKKQRQN